MKQIIDWIIIICVAAIVLLPPMAAMLEVLKSEIRSFKTKSKIRQK